MTPWLACPDPRPRARLRLVCFPHAGGSAAFFHRWGRALPDIEVHAVRYPGRADRSAEPPATDVLQLAHDTAQAVLAGVDGPVALFGHSLGATVAFETARALRAEGAEPVHLFVSGSRAPHLPPSDLAHRAARDDAGILATLRELGGTDDRLLNTPLFRDVVLPTIRGDFHLADTYRHHPAAPLSCPLTALVGDTDPEVSAADCAAWSPLTRGPFTHQVLPGDHFYLAAEPPFPVLLDRLSTTGAEPWAHDGCRR
ncbi:thioesterase II family protein [Streptomyces sp. NPDC048331]|uniref:thioesterase II family protein n=1 Tax=Streptomyces sp. NPDC048331 TaxID=3365534 RepID=UPI003722BA49